MDRQRSPFFSSSSCYDPFPSERMKFVSRQWVRRRKSSEGRRFVILASFMRLPLAAVAQPVVTTIRSVLFLTRTAPGDFCSSAAGNPGAGGEPRRSSSDVPAARREEVGACADRTFSLLSLALTRSLSLISSPSHLLILSYSGLLIPSPVPYTTLPPVHPLLHRTIHPIVL